MEKKPVLGIIGLSDGDQEVHAQLKDIVQAQVDAIVKALRAIEDRRGIAGDVFVIKDRKSVV